MATATDLLVTRLELAGLGTYTTGMGRAAAAAGVLAQRLDDAGRQQMNLAVGFGAISAGIVSGLSRAVRAAGNLQQVETGFRSMLGSAEAARAKIEELQQFAATSPFDFAQTARGAQQLLAMGVAAQDLIPTMSAVGNAVSAAGGDTETFLGALRAIGQINTKGVLSQEELNQLAERGIPAARILQKELGLTADQMRNIGNQGIPAAKAVAALVRGFNGQFGGAMEAQAKTLNGALSNLTDASNRAVASLGQPLVPWVTNVTQGITAAVDQFNRLPGPAKDAATLLAVTLATGAAVASGRLALLAAQNVRLTNEQLRTTRSTKAQASATEDEARAHDRAATAIRNHASAEGRLHSGASGGAGGAGAAAVAVAANKNAGSQAASGSGAAAGAAGAAAAGTVGAAAAARRGAVKFNPDARGQFSATELKAAHAEMAAAEAAGVKAAGAVVKGSALSRIGSSLKGGLGAVVASLAADAALGMLPNEGSVGVGKRIAQGAATGAAWGATVGSIVPGIGTGVGAAALGLGGAAIAGFQEWQASQAAKTATAAGTSQDVQAALLEEARQQTAILKDLRDSGIVDTKIVPQGWQLSAMRGAAHNLR